METTWYLRIEMRSSAPNTRAGKCCVALQQPWRFSRSFERVALRTVVPSEVSVEPRTARASSPRRAIERSASELRRAALRYRWSWQRSRGWCCRLRHEKRAAAALPLLGSRARKDGRSSTTQSSVSPEAVVRSNSCHLKSSPSRVWSTVRSALAGSAVAGHAVVEAGSAVSELAARKRTAATKQLGRRKKDLWLCRVIVGSR